MNLQTLRNELDAGSYDADPQVAAEQLNAVTVPVHKPVEAALIKRYMILNDIWLPVKTSAEPAAVTAYDAVKAFESFEMDVPEVYAKVSQMLDALIMLSLITTDHKAGILALANDTISKADQLGLGRVRANDVIRARAI